MGKINHDSFVVDDVLNAIVGDSKGKKDDKKSDKKKDKAPKKEEKKKDKKKDKKSSVDSLIEEKFKENPIKPSYPQDEIDGEIIMDIEVEGEEPKTADGKTIKVVENDEELFEVMLATSGEESAKKMIKATNDPALYIAFVEWAIENKKNISTEHMRAAIELQGLETEDKESKKKDKKKDKKSDKKDKKKKDKKSDKKDKDKKSKKSKKKDKDDEDKKSKKAKKKNKKKAKKSKPTSDDEDLDKAFKTWKKREKEEDEILSADEIAELTESFSPMNPMDMDFE